MSAPQIVMNGDTARARKSDPLASHAAADKSAATRGQVHEAVVQLITEYGPHPTVVVWDAGHSGRKEIAPEYKATRQSRPDLLREQWPHLGPIAEAFGYRNVTVDGYEADDVIATIAERARDARQLLALQRAPRDLEDLAFALDDGLVRIAALRSHPQAHLDLLALL